MRRLTFLTLAALAMVACRHHQPALLNGWKQHDENRPQPPVVTPPAEVAMVPAPSDAVVLFDGRDLSQWQSAGDSTMGQPARWTVRDDYMEVAKGTGPIQTARSFGDVQLHVEWMAPAPPEGEGQERGNSGVFFMGRYEVQVLDSYQNRTYPDGQAGAVYGQYPPLVNPSRPPGTWQTYDIVFHRPRFDASGKLQSPARLTVLFNGVLVQNDVALIGPTSHGVRTPYEAHPDRLPISLQDHGFPVRFRNVWARALEP